MKRLFSKKSGFTVVEIVMAFLIFAIMAGMILAVLRLAVQQRASNRELANDLDTQTQKLVESDKNKQCSEYNDGKIVLNVGGKAIASVNYELQGVTDSKNEEGINYFVGENNNVKGNNLTTPNIEGSGKAVTKRVDSRIYGSTGFDHIRVYSIQRDTSYSNPNGSVRYFFEVSAFHPYDDSKAKDVESRETWQYFLSFPGQTIKEVGYNDGAAGLKNAERTSAPTTQNEYQVRKVGAQSVLISIPGGSDKSFSYEHSKIYVVFQAEPNILPIGVDTTAGMTDTQREAAFKYFGDNADLSNTDYAQFTYQSLDAIINKDKDPKDIIGCVNIYGGKQLAEEEADEEEE